MNHVHLLADEQVEALRSVLGLPVYHLFTRSMEAEGRRITAPDFSLSLGGDAYCVVQSDWSDTVDEGIDFHVMEVSIRDWPRRVARVRDDDGREMMGYPSSIRLGGAMPLVECIQVLEYREAGEKESVHYDRALVFTRDDESRFALSAHESIAGGLDFTEHDAAIEALLADYAERLRVE